MEKMGSPKTLVTIRLHGEGQLHVNAVSDIKCGINFSRRQAASYDREFRVSFHVKCLILLCDFNKK
jgi:hypothetical protein